MLILKLKYWLAIKMSKSLLAGVHRFHMSVKVCFLAKALVTNAALMLFELFMDAFNMASKIPVNVS
jgi:hypothetical protein